MALLVDATTAEHARGIRTVILGILGALPGIVSPDAIISAGPSLELAPALSVRRVSLARTRPGRLLYQRLLVPFDAARLGTAGAPIDRVLLLDSYVPLLRPPGGIRYAALVHDLLPLTHPEYRARSVSSSGLRCSPCAVPR